MASSSWRGPAVEGLAFSLLAVLALSLLPYSRRNARIGNRWQRRVFGRTLLGRFIPDDDTAAARSEVATFAIGVALLLLALYRFGQCLELVGKS